MQCANLWFLLVFLANIRASIIEEFAEMSNDVLYPREDPSPNLPIDLGADRSSGCICRATKNYESVVCFGNYVCRKFPKVMMQSEVLRVRTTVIEKIVKGDLDKFSFLTVLEIEANHKLIYIEPGTFQNLSKLEHLSISYNTALHSIHKNTFEGLRSLRNLTLANNGFTNILQLTYAFRPKMLPWLKTLDISENWFDEISETAFSPMQGTYLRKLDLNLCSLDYIHPNSFLPLKNLKELILSDNDLSGRLIGNFLLAMTEEGVNITHLDLSGLGFRKQPPKGLLDIIAQTSIKNLNLAQNQFEFISDDTFPLMPNIQILDLRKVQAINVGPNAFDPTKFPNLKVLLLGGNNLPGIHQKHLSSQLLLLDLSNNKGNHVTPVYYEIDKDTFIQSTELIVLNLAYNRIKSIFDYTFRGLNKLEMLNLENGTIYFIGDGTFKSTKRLQMLNLANNPLTSNGNLTCAQFDGLNKLQTLILKNCGIKRFYDDENIFEMMPNLRHLILRNNQIYFITAEILKPLKLLEVLDLSENLLVTWWRPLFLASGVRPIQLQLTNNKISHFSISMIQDISFLLEGHPNSEIDLLENVFICDCNSMYTTYLWLEINGSMTLKSYFSTSSFLCSSPDLWEDKRVADFLTSIKSLHCLMYAKISNVMVIVWTAPSLITILIVLLILALLYKYRIYIRYWIFLGKLALGRRFIRKPLKAENIEHRGYKYDAFVSYSFEDRDFVLEMITQLETFPPYLKLCISERDFEIGSFISEAVLTGINESRYIVLLISNNFLKSQWCRWETQLAEYHRLFLEDGTCHDPLVLVKLGNLDKKQLTPTLKYLLKTKIYLSWDAKHVNDFWKKLRNVLARTK